MLGPASSYSALVINIPEGELVAVNHLLVARAADERGEGCAGHVVTGEAGLAHAGKVSTAA
jgi:hypothetical protein